MGRTFNRLLGIMVLAGVAYAQQTPPNPPLPPLNAPSQNQQEADEARREAEQERAEALQEAAEERAEAQKEADEARTEALKEAEQARAEAQKEADEARREAAQEAAKARKEAEQARTEARREAAKAREQARKARAAARSTSYLGVGARDINGNGADVFVVDQDSPAAKAGIREHDLIVSFNGRPVKGYDDLRRMMHESKAGSRVKLGIVRGGKRQDVFVALGRRDPRMFAWAGPNGGKIEIPKVVIPPIPPVDIDVPSFTMLQSSSRNGIMVEDLSPQLAEFFGIREGQGVLIRAVDRGSAGDVAGLRAGDVIVRVGNERVTCSSDWRRTVREHKTGSVVVGIIRDKREQSVTMKLPDRVSDASRFNGAQFNQEMAGLKQQLAMIEPDIQKQLASAQKQWESNRAKFEQQMKEAQKTLQSFSNKQ